MKTGRTLQHNELLSKEGGNLSTVIWNWYKFEKSNVEQVQV